MEYFTDQLVEFFNKYGAQIVGFILAFLMALWRTSQANGKVDWLESFMCAGLTLGIASTLSYLNVPQSLSIAVGAFVCYLGTHKVGRFISRKIDAEDHLGYSIISVTQLVDKCS